MQRQKKMKIGRLDGRLTYSRHRNRHSMSSIRKADEMRGFHFDGYNYGAKNREKTRYGCIKRHCRAKLLINPNHDWFSIKLLERHTCLKSTHESLNVKKMRYLCKLNAAASVAGTSSRAIFEATCLQYQTLAPYVTYESMQKTIERAQVKAKMNPVAKAQHMNTVDPSIQNNLVNPSIQNNLVNLTIQNSSVKPSIQDNFLNPYVLNNFLKTPIQYLQQPPLLLIQATNGEQLSISANLVQSPIISVESSTEEFKQPNSNFKIQLDISVIPNSNKLF